ncbi:MAG TPA: class I SAM-dependent methyltransferase [Pirellulales bacterium]|jgi:methyltransferase-like protein/SAM-dependent methyltransferase|nr:class I SAM-dependent methyltransferase [Pirellulales bacterium]
MSNPSATANIYDEIPYEAHSVAKSHPDRMATVARLFGLKPKRIDRCRVLELGCAMGANLIPMAERHPESTFVGIDYSARQVETGHAAVERLGLTNIDLKHLSILDVGAEVGKFDYIITHGVYSWVDSEVRDKILDIVHEHLEPQGIGYVSFNALPAWHLRGIAREIGFTASSSDTPPTERVARMRQALQFFLAALAPDNSPYARLVKTDFDFVTRQSTNYLYHEYFEKTNQPFYVHEFASHLASHRLQYLGDAVIETMFAANLGQKVEHNLLRIASGVIPIEQHMDMLSNRVFRNSLVCLEDLPLRRHLDFDSLAGLYLAGNVRPVNPAANFAAVGTESFQTASKGLISTPTPALKIALAELGRRWPASIGFEALQSEIDAKLAAAGATAPLGIAERRGLGDNLVQCLATGVIQAYSEADSFITAVSARPQASPLARIEAAFGPIVTNRRHETVVLDQISQNALVHLDGEHDWQSLLGILREAVEQGRLSILKDGLPIARHEVLGGILETALERCLAKIASNAFLVA